MKLLSDKQIGMRQSFDGFMRNLKNVRCNPQARWLLEMLNEHMNELATRYYAGDITVVDEFLQLYCIGKDERKKRADVEKNEIDPAKRIIIDMLAFDGSHGTFDASELFEARKRAGTFASDDEIKLAQHDALVRLDMRVAEINELEARHD